MQKGSSHKPESIKKMSASIKKTWEEIPLSKRQERVSAATKARLEKMMALDASGDIG